MKQWFNYSLLTACKLYTDDHCQTAKKNVSPFIRNSELCICYKILFWPAIFQRYLPSSALNPVLCASHIAQKANWLVSPPFLSSALVEPKRLERPRHVGYETTEFENRGQDSFCPRVWLHTLEPLRNGCLFDLLEDSASTGQTLAGVFSRTLGKFMPLVSQSVKARKPDLE